MTLSLCALFVGLSSCSWLFPIVFQVEFIQTFPPEAAGNLPLWQHISFQAFPVELRKQAAREVTSVGAAQSRGWLHSSRTVGELELLASDQFH